MRREHLRLLLAAGLLAGVLIGLALLPGLIKRWAPSAASRGARLVSAHGNFPVTVQDAFGQSVTVKRRPARIVSLAPAVTEILFAIGAGDRVIADTTYCDYPPAAAKLQKIGGYLDPNAELVASLSPDLVIGARGNKRDILEHLRSLGLTVVAVDPTSLDALERDMRLIGSITGVEVQANTAIAALTARREAVCARLQDIPDARRPRTLLLFSPADLYTVGPGNHVDELMRLAGGRNVAGEAATPWPQLSMEKVIAADPQVIIVLGSHGSGKPLTDEQALATFKAQRPWQTVSAVKEGRVSVVDDDIITIPGPRLLDGLEAMARVLHPELSGEGGR